MNARIAALGPRDFVMPFGAVGAATFPVENDTQAREQAQVILKENFAVILLHEALAPALGPIFEKLQEQPTPCIVALPFIEPSTGQAVQQLRTALKRATGTDIWDAASKSPQTDQSNPDASASTNTESQ